MASNDVLRRAIKGIQPTGRAPARESAFAPPLFCVFNGPLAHRCGSKALVKERLREIAEKLRMPWLFRLLKPVVGPFPSLYRHLHFHGEIRVDIDRARSFKMIHYGYQVENALFWQGFGGGFEAHAMNVWGRLSQDAECIVDVGANTGVYALASAAINSRARIIAVEPVGRIFDKLRTNVKLNQFAIECVEGAASDTDGTATMYDIDAEHSYSSSLESSMLDATATRKVEITCFRLDTFATSHNLPRLDLIKIDAEKHEPKVLAGMTDILARDKPTILVEVLDEIRANEIYEILSEIEYNYFFVDEEKGLIRLSRPGQIFGNYLICGPDAALVVGEN